MLLKYDNLVRFKMADSKVPSQVRAIGSVTRSQARKRRIIDGQEKVKEEENDKGFRFTRQSKRVRQRNQGHLSKITEVQNDKFGEKQAVKEKKVQTVSSLYTLNKTPEAQNDRSADKNAVKEKKKRRSSFIRGRKIHSPLDICKSQGLAAVQGLYKEISTDLSPNARLLQLCDKSLLLICANAKDKEYMNIPNFGEKVEEFASHLRTSLKNSDIAKRAAEQKNEVDERIVIPNPKAQQLERYAQASRNITERMRKEDKAWEEILERYQNENASTEEEIMESYRGLNRECLSEEQKESLDSVQSNTGILERLDRLQKESILMIDKIAATTKTVKALDDAASDYLERTTRELIESPTPMIVSATPRHLIHEITKDSEKPS